MIADRHTDCAHACQQAEAYGVWPEHSCKPTCVWLSAPQWWLDKLQPSDAELQAMADEYQRDAIASAQSTMPDDNTEHE